MTLKTPLLLNFTGHIIRYKHSLKDEQSGKISFVEVEIPPIGKVTLEHKNFREEEALFATEIQVIHGLPEQKNGVLYIVPEYVAALLSGKRSDLLYILNQTEELTNNPINPNEKRLVGDELSRFISDYQAR